MRKPILCLDFDGVCHSYKSGWKGATIIPDEPVSGMWNFIERAWQRFEIHIYSSRSHQPGGVAAMQAWFLKTADSAFRRQLAAQELKFPLAKPPALVTLDDRALTFTGTWPDPVELLQFKPWNKKEE